MASSQRFSAIFLMAVVCSILVFSSNISAAEFDNAISNYDEKTETITFSNGCLFEVGWTCMGDEIGKVQLKTPRNYKVAPGYNYVWEIEASVYENYNDFLKQFEYLDMKTEKKVSRTIDIKILSYEEVEVNDYYNKCNKEFLKNGTELLACERIQEGSHFETKEVWSKVTPADLKKNDKVTLRGYTDVGVGDYVDWSPEIFGARVGHDIWATWTASLNVGLVSYYKLDEQDTTGSGTIIDSLGINNGTNDGTDNITGKIKTGYDFVAANTDKVDIPDNTLLRFSTTMTASAWVKSTSTSANTFVVNKYDHDTGDKDWALVWGTGGTVRVMLGSGGDIEKNYESTTSVNDGNWHHIGFTFDSGTIEIYIDGVKETSVTKYTDDPLTSIHEGDSAMTFGSRLGGGSGENYWNGELDEISLWNRTLSDAEFTQQYNSNIGISYQKEEPVTQVVDVDITSPTDNASLTDLIIDFYYIPIVSFAIDKAELWVAKLSNATNFEDGTQLLTTTKSTMKKIHLVDMNDTGSEKDIVIAQLGGLGIVNAGGVWYCEGNSSESDYFNDCEKIIVVEQGDFKRGCESVGIGDLDNDGYLDVVAGTETTYVSIVYGNASNSPPFNAQINSSAITTMETDYLAIGHGSSEDLMDIFVLTEDPELKYFIANNSKSGFKYDTAISLGALSGSDSGQVATGYVSNESRVDVFPVPEEGYIYRCGYNNSESDNYDTCTIIEQYKYDLTSLLQPSCAGEGMPLEITSRTLDINSDGLPDILTGFGNETFMILSNSSESDWYNDKTVLEEDWENVTCMQDGQIIDYNEDGVLDWIINDRRGGMWIFIGNKSESDYFNSPIEMNITKIVQHQFRFDDITENNVLDIVMAGNHTSTNYGIYFHEGERPYENWENVTSNSSSITNASSNSLQYTFSEYGTYKWNVKVYDNDSMSSFAPSNYTFTTSEPPTAININLNNPSDFYTSQIKSVTFDCNATDPIGITRLNLTINGGVNETITNSSGAENLSISKAINLSEGVYNWGCTAESLIDSLSSSNRTLTVSYSNPIVTLILPVDTDNKTTQNVEFTLNATDINGINNVSLYINDILNETNSSGVNGSYSFQKILAAGDYNWSAKVYSILDKLTTSETRTLTLNFSGPTIILDNPEADANLTNSYNNFTFNVTSGDGVKNVSLLIDDAISNSSSSGANGSYGFLNTLPDGSYNWSVEAYSILNEKTTSLTRDFRIDTLLPQISITSPTGVYGTLEAGQSLDLNWTVTDANLDSCWYGYRDELLDSIGNDGWADGDRYGWIYVEDKDNQQFNLAGYQGFGSVPGFRIWKDSLDTSGSYVQNIVTQPDFFNENFTVELNDNGWHYYLIFADDIGPFDDNNITMFKAVNPISYAQTNIPVSCLDNHTNFNYSQDANEITFFANDTIGNVANSTKDWIVQFVEGAQTYPTESTESKTETYSASISYNSSLILVSTGSLEIGGTTYTGSKSGTGDTVIFSTDAIMPSVDVTTNYTAAWTISLTDENGTTETELTPHNVSVGIINMSLCGEGYNTSFWNFTILNETNLGEVTSSFDATFSVKLTGSSQVNYFSYSDTSDSESSFDFCMYPPEESYTIDTAIQLEKDGYVTKFYNYEDVVVTNATREDNLYMMITGDSTSFIVHTVDVSATDVIGAEIRVQRYYPGTNSWLTTEIITTNDEGEAIGHILSEDADYKFLVYQGGASVYNSSSTKIACTLAPCTVTLVIPINFETGIEETENLDSSLSFNPSTSIFTYSYSDTSSVFSSARLYVLRLSPSNSTVIVPCDESKTSISGVITCDISGQLNGTYQASGYITRNSDEFLDKRIAANYGSGIYDSMGNDGVLWAIFIFMAMVMLGLTRPSMAIIFGTIGFITIGLIGIINIGVVSIVAISAIGIILLVRTGRE